LNPVRDNCEIVNTMRVWGGELRRKKGNKKKKKKKPGGQGGPRGQRFCMSLREKKTSTFKPN